ncbi:MAG: agmatinase [Chloroflexi bacterium]|nr:agmatinase [Chloroflexota bacterium]
MPDRLRFLASKPRAIPSAIVFGAPLDLTESFRRGAGLAPPRIREVSDSIESYSPALDADLEDINLVDWGDVPLDGLDLPGSLSEVETWAQRAAGEAPFLILGGEHTISLGAIEGLMKRYSNLVVVQIDAHLDLIDSFAGLSVSHATAFRRVVEYIGAESLVQLGVRSGTRDEFALAKTCLHSSPDLSLPPAIRRRLSGAPIYLSIDIDVLDPSCAPGTGNPEPGGHSFHTLVSFLYGLRGLNVVGMDIVEVSPPLDPSDITAAAAAKLARELILLFGRRVAIEKPSDPCLLHSGTRPLAKFKP